MLNENLIESFSATVRKNWELDAWRVDCSDVPP